MREELKQTPNDHQKAQKEVAFLLNILIHTINEEIGTMAGTVSTSAGKEAARKMPAYFENRDIKTILEEIKKYFNDGFGITYTLENNEITLTFDRCALKDICRIEGIQLGGDLCRHFHNYLNGIVIEHAGTNYDVDIIQYGEHCIVTHTRPNW